MRLDKSVVVSAIAGAVLGVTAEELTVGKNNRKTLRQAEDGLEKSQEFYFILLQWIKIHQEGRTLVDYFKKNNYKTVAVYGMKELGEALLEELDGSDIEVKYGIDRNAENIYAGIDIYTPDEKLDDVDVVVVTAVHYFDEIELDMQTKVKGKIVSLEDVVWEA